jgi:hypothetical protein
LRAGTEACPYEDHEDGYDPPSEHRRGVSKRRRRRALNVP